VESTPRDLRAQCPCVDVPTPAPSTPRGMIPRMAFSVQALSTLKTFYSSFEPRLMVLGARFRVLAMLRNDRPSRFDTDRLYRSA
jgi:hypothetical protein